MAHFPTQVVIIGAGRAGLALVIKPSGFIATV